MSTPSIDYETFKSHRASILASHPDILDVSETAMARVMAPYRFPIDEADMPEKAHRCHLAEDWLAAFGLPESWKRRALVGIGVRDSLERLLRHYANKGAWVSLPSDVYPTYHQISERTGGLYKRHDTYPAIDHRLLIGCDVLVLCNPMKPRGYALGGDELNGILGWLRADPKRRVIIDAVYTFGNRFDAGTMLLVSTGQAWLLHSLSKGWASPLVMGVALAPEADLDEVVSIFRDIPPDQARLRQAHVMLRTHAWFPQTLPGLLSLAEARMRDDLAERDVRPLAVPNPAPRYLFLVERGWDDLVEDNGVLAMPYSVFGRNVPGLSVVSSLGHLPGDGR